MSTWGIDGQVFTGIYAGLVAATGAVAVLADQRRGLSGRPPTGAEELDEYELAYLAGGAQLVAIVALVNLDRRGAIGLGDDLLRELRDAEELDLDKVRDGDDLADLGVELHISLAKESVANAAVSHPVEAAALKAVRGTQPRSPWRVVSAITGTRTVDAVRSELVRRGLLHEPADVERLRHRWRWLLPVLVVGGMRLLADLGARQSVGLLLVAMLATVGVMIALARRRPVRTRRGDRLVATMRRRRPVVVDAQADGCLPTGMALAMGGTAGLWASDRALALAVAAPSPVTQRPLRERLSQPRRGWWPVGGWSGGAGCGGGWDGGGGGHGCGGGGGHGCGGGGGGGCGGGGGGGCGGGG